MTSIKPTPEMGRISDEMEKQRTITRHLADEARAAFIAAVKNQLGVEVGSVVIWKRWRQVKGAWGRFEEKPTKAIVRRITSFYNDVELYVSLPDKQGWKEVAHRIPSYETWELTDGR